MVFNKEYRSEQFLIWEHIDRMSKEYKVDSETSAMRDVYERVKKNLEDKMKYFSYVEGQNGIVVFRDGIFEGISIITLSSAYEKIHHKLIKSYLFIGWDLRYGSKEYMGSILT